MNIPILLVEDDATTGEMLSEVLEDAGYRVTLARSGTEALDLLEKQSFTVVVSDIRMHPVDGIAVLHAARQSAAPSEVILLTGYGALDTALAALRDGAFDYLLKPCKPEILLKRVADAVSASKTRQRHSEALQRIMNELNHLTGTSSSMMPPPTTRANGTQHTPESEEDIIQIGELCIGLAHHTATFAGQPLHLTPMEHALLRCLAEVPGHILSYRELVHRMHGYDVINPEAQVLLKTHVRNVRRKIGRDYLVNIRSIGYKLKTPETTEQSHELEDAAQAD